MKFTHTRVIESYLSGTTVSIRKQTDGHTEAKVNL